MSAVTARAISPGMAASTERFWSVRFLPVLERQRSRKNFKFGQFGANFTLEGLADDEQHRMISNAMSKLTPGLRRALELREFDERSIKETARMMGISIEHVKSRVFRGRRKLSRLLDRPKPGPCADMIHRA